MSSYDNGRRIVSGSEGGTQDAAERDRHLYSQNNYDHGCFPGEVLIATPQGFKAISSLKAGDHVCTPDNNRTANILKVKRHRSNPIINLHTTGGKIRTTLSHSFYSNKKWRRVSQLSVGDMLDCDHDGKASFEITSITKEASESVYNLITSSGTFIVENGFIVHSFSYFRKTRSILTNLLHGNVIYGNALSAKVMLPALLSR